MKKHIYVSAILAVFVASCYMSSKNLFLAFLQDKGEVLNKWNDGKDDYMIIREDTRIVQYRITELQAYIQYAADTVTHICYTGITGSTPLPCESLIKVQTMKPYITWCEKEVVVPPNTGATH